MRQIAFSRPRGKPSLDSDRLQRASKSSLLPRNGRQGRPIQRWSSDGPARHHLARGPTQPLLLNRASAPAAVRHILRTFPRKLPTHGPQLHRRHLLLPVQLHRTWQLFSEIGVLCCRLLQKLFRVLHVTMEHVCSTVTMKRALKPR